MLLRILHVFIQFQQKVWFQWRFPGSQRSHPWDILPWSKLMRLRHRENVTGEAISEETHLIIRKEKIMHWSLIIIHWSLIIVHWFLIIIHWSLIIIHWSLIATFVDLVRHLPKMSGAPVLNHRDNTRVWWSRTGRTWLILGDGLQ